MGTSKLFVSMETYKVRPCNRKKTAGRLAPVSKKLLYLDGIQFADAKRREQSLPPTAVVGFRSEAGVAKDRLPAVNVDADRALISFEEMPITPVDPTTKRSRSRVGKSAVLPWSNPPS